MFAALAALGAGCNNKRKQEGKEPLVVEPTPSGSGSATPEDPKPDVKLVARGEYLSGMLGCGSCHMAIVDKVPDFTRQFAGGMEVQEKFGTWRAPNITQHKGSGIGGWTDEQIAAAIREGVRPDGGKLYPIMPYLNYNRMTDDDVKALVAFLRTVKPIDNVVAPNKDLKIPQPPAAKPANAPDPTGDPVKHGEYLVTLMHCSMCHSPMGKDGMPDMTKPFAGGFEMELPMLGTGKLYGPNITSDPTTGIGSWSAADVEKSVKFLTRRDGTIIQGPMQLYLAGWSKITDPDLHAIGAYVKTIPPIRNKVPKSTFKPVATGSGSAAGSATAPVVERAGSGNAGMGSAAGNAGSGSAAPTAGSGSATR